MRGWPFADTSWFIGARLHSSRRLSQFWRAAVSPKACLMHSRLSLLENTTTPFKKKYEFPIKKALFPMEGCSRAPSLPVLEKDRHLQHCSQPLLSHRLSHGMRSTAPFLSEAHLRQATPHYPANWLLIICSSLRFFVMKFL